MTENSSKHATHEFKGTNENRSATPATDAFANYMREGWASENRPRARRLPVADYAAARRERLAAAFPGGRLVIAAGIMKQRANDTFFRFRAHSAFAHLTGWGSAAQPGAYLVFDPIENTSSGGQTHRATLYFRPRAGRDTPEFFSDPELGEFWIGKGPTLEDVHIQLGIATAHLDELEFHAEDVTLANENLAREVSQLRLVKDAYEIAQMRQAVAATARGFNDVIAALPQAIAEPRGERVIEGAFGMRARIDGNECGYDTIAAAGPNACTLHWIDNSGPVRPGELLLLDAGVEMDSLYTADITRTLPVTGSFTSVQKRVYEAVLEAADAARAIVRPGIRFRDIHEEAMRVIAEKTRQWGLHPEDMPEQHAPHRRYMVHGTSHHLGLDVHDCAQAKRELYMDGTLEEGMVFTIEPGLYFHPDDLSVPSEYRGIGVRIEDNILVTETGCENLSAGIPRKTVDVENWVQAKGALEIPAEKH